MIQHTHPEEESLLELTQETQLQLRLPRGAITRQENELKSTTDLVIASWIAERIITCGKA
jgi:hypothetical protein